MDSNSTLWCTSSHPLSIHAEVATAAPTTFPEVGYSILSFLMFINTGLSVFNNCLIITVIVRHPSLRQPMNIFILGLAVSHDRPVRLPGCHHHQLPWLLIGHSACAFQGFAVNYFGKWSYKTIVCLIGTLETNVLFCVISSYGPEGVQTSCSLDWEQRTWSNFSHLILYTLLCFIFPVAAIIYCHICLLLTAEQECRASGWAFYMVLAMIIAFFVCWLPYTALSVVVVVDPELNIPPLIATVPMYFAKNNQPTTLSSTLFPTSSDPIIYAAVNPQFRTEFYRLKNNAKSIFSQKR
uniref:G-protein coupled receptors family 1 profile domain-containing protein n=1 Tax=Monopterus albus TaxID=43700 RepID=A0A3Q3J6X8_MONAL